MIKILDIGSSEKWDAIVSSFKQYDLYYLSGYAKAFELHGDGTPILIHYDNGEMRGICVMMKRDISLAKGISGIEPNEYYDLITPYGYGGFYFEGSITEESMKTFHQEYLAALKFEKVVSVFYRFHPILQNANFVRNTETVIDLGKTIHMDLCSEDLIWSNLASKNRNTIRKAEKLGVEIKHGKSMELFDQFIEIYNKTMDHDEALDYYYFDRDFYQSIHKDLYDNYEMFYAELDGKIIAMSIILFANEQMHYHLSGSVFEYRNMAPSNLLLYKAACWGSDKGFKTFHLGGGVGSGEDSLYNFKKKFNRNATNQFSIGKLIVNQEKYDELVALRQKNDINFDTSSGFFPLYRS